MPFRKTCGTHRDFRLESAILLQKCSHRLRGGHGKIDDASARANRRQHVLRTRRTQEPNRMPARLLNLLEQHVGGAFQHAIDIFDNDDAPRRSAWHLLGRSDDVSHLVDADGHFVGGQHGHVGVSAGKHLLRGFGRLVAKTMIGALQRRSKRARHIGTTRSRRTANQPGLRNGFRIATCDGFELFDNLLLADNRIPHAHWAASDWKVFI